MTQSTSVSPTPASRSFADLGLIDPLLRALIAEGYDTPTPIQNLAIPPVLSGRDMMGLAQTGTGKTAAFALPVLQRLHHPHSVPSGARRPVRCLVLAPTRELALQIGESFAAYGRHTGLKQAVVFGGVGMMPQVEALRRGIDVLVACPGRLLDLMQNNHVSFQNLEVLVLDEADRMLDMGFIHDIRRILKHLPTKRQTLMFSATMTPDIETLARGLLHDPAKVEVAPVSSTAETVAQSLYFVEKAEKSALLRHLIESQNIRKALVFTRTKHMANRVSEGLEKVGIGSAAFHANKSQNARQRALSGFHAGEVRILVATDIAARGIDVDEITHVINYDLPNEPEAYVHRIGRTGRAGARGQAISFCSSEEREFLPFIERTIRKLIPRVDSHPNISRLAPPPMTDLESKRGLGRLPPPIRDRSDDRPPRPQRPQRGGGDHRGAGGRPGVRPSGAGTQGAGMPRGQQAPRSSAPHARSGGGGGQAPQARPNGGQTPRGNGGTPTQQGAATRPSFDPQRDTPTKQGNAEGDSYAGARGWRGRSTR